MAFANHPLLSSKSNFMGAKIDRSNVLSIIELNAVQKGMLYHYLKDMDQALYHVQLSVRIDGKLNIDRLKDALQIVQGNNDVLRSVFRWEGLTHPIQVILRSLPIDFTIEDIADQWEGSSLQSVEDIVRTDWQARFDLTRQAVRFKLIKANASTFFLNISHHHILYDGWSTGILLKEIFHHYRSLVREGTSDYIPKVSFVDLFDNLRIQENSVDGIRFWEQYLSHYEAPVCFAKPAREGSLPAIPQLLKFTCPVSSIEEFCSAHEVTKAAVVYALWGTLLQQYSGIPDLVIGIPVSGRALDQAGMDQVIGNFVKTIPLRFQQTSEKTFLQLVEEVSHHLLSAEQVHAFSLAGMKRFLQLDADSFLFDTLVVVENYPIDQSLLDASGDFNISLHQVLEDTGFPLVMTVFFHEQLVIEFSYQKGQVTAAEVNRLWQYLRYLMADLPQLAEQKLPTIQLVPEVDLRLQVGTFNDTAHPYSSEATLVSLFAKQAVARGAAPALWMGDAAMSYGELDRRSNQIAHYLSAERGVKHGDLVGVMLERELDLLPVIFGILKAGAAYVPIDPAYPAARIGMIVEDSGVDLIISRSAFYADVELSVQWLEMDELVKGLSTQSAEALSIGLRSQDLAYVIFTSGSTGRPKGVMIEHGSVVNRLEWMQRQYPLSTSDVLLQKTPIVFDVSVWELFWWSLCGAQLSLLGPGEEKDPAAISAAIGRYGVSTIHFVPSMLSGFLSHLEGVGTGEELSSLRQVFCSGEALKPWQVDKFGSLLHQYHRSQLINLYGPTEATVDVSYYGCEFTGKTDLVPIGRPIQNTQLYIVGKDGQLLPPGVTGELCIGGVGLARGYINNEALTAERFEQLSSLGGQRIYHTGDLAYWQEDGNIVYQGRMDHQVKIRGYRIELGEIERQLQQYTAIQETVVMVKDQGGEPQLVAYYVAAQPVSVEALQAHLSTTLPAYMVPRLYVYLEEIPLSINGKVNRKALPNPVFYTEKTYVAPRNEKERLLCEIWQIVLGVERVGIKDRFFAIGGDSISCIQVSAKLRTKGYLLSVQSIAKEKNIASLADEMLTLPLAPKPKIQGPTYPKTLTSGQLEQLQENYEIEYIYPLTPIQAGMLLLSTADPAQYFQQRTLFINGQLDHQILEMALQDLVAKHEAFRTLFLLQEFPEPYQMVLKQRAVEFVFEDITSFCTTLKEADFIVSAYLERDRKRGFDLRKDTLLRVKLFKIGVDTYRLVWSNHHVIMDGWCLHLIWSDLRDFYDQRRDGQVPAVTTLSTIGPYFEWLEQQDVSRAEQYWKAYLDGYSHTAVLPTKDYASLQAVPDQQRSERMVLNSSYTSQLKQLAQVHDLTLNNILECAWGVLLGKYNNASDVIFGKVVSGRPAEVTHIEQMVGLFIRTVPARVQFSAAEGFLQLVQQHQEQSFAGTFANHLPLTSIQDLTPLKQGLFNHVLVFENYPLADQLNHYDFKGEIGNGIQVQKIESSSGTNYDLNLVIYPSQELQLEIEFNTNRYSTQMVRQLLRHYLNIIQQIIDDPNISIDQIELLDQEERNELLVAYDRTAVPYPEGETIVSLFQKQVAARPHNLAVQFQDERLSYLELDHRSNQLARLLLEQGVSSNQVVALLLDRSLEVVVGMLAILKAGAAYLPLDVDYPTDRNRQLLQDSQAKVLLTNKRCISDSPFDLPTLCLEEAERFEIAEIPQANEVQPTDLCYIIYTSGTTGHPKGVMIEHRNVVRLFFNDAFQFDFDERDVWTMFHSPCFDFSVWELYGALLFGGRVIIIPKRIAKDPAAYLELLREEQVTILNQTPSAFYSLMHEELLSQDVTLCLRYVVFGGEALYPGKLRAWFDRYPQVKLVNMFGITETTVHVTFKKIGKTEIKHNISNIGRPIPTLSLYLLDAQGRLLPKGAIGEMYVGGAGLARGYLNRLALTKEKFVFSDDLPGVRLYKTGDTAKILASGEIKYLDRLDHQVQVRGFRIELGEIEHRLSALPGIKEAVVIYDTTEASPRLVAYYLTTAVSMEEPDLRQQLLRCLPDYMIPNFFIPLPAFPLTSNGKLDRKALPKPLASKVDKVDLPKNEIQKALVSIWAEILGVAPEKIGIHASFFEIGGNSLGIPRMAQLIQERLDVQVSVAQLFTYPFISALAQFLEDDQEETEEQEIDLEQRIAAIDLLNHLT